MKEGGADVSHAARKRPDDALRVLMVDTVPLIRDGIATVMLNYAGHMRRDGLQLDFLANNDVPAELREAIRAMGSRLHVVPGRNRRPLGYMRDVRRIVRENGYDVVHAHGNSCTLAVDLLAAKLGGARARCPHSHNTYSTAPLTHRLLRPLFDRLYTRGFACSEAAGRWLFGKRPFTVLNNGTDIARYRFDASARAECRGALGIGNRLAVGHVGHFTDQKNHAFLLDAFERSLARDPDRVLVLVGDGPNRPAIEAAVREKGLEMSVILTGVRRDVPRLLSAMDLMALPSRFEGLPNVLVEWQASGLPVLASDVVDPAADMTGGIRFLPLDMDVWTNALLDAAVATDAAREAASAAAAGDITRAGYDIEANAERLRRIYFECAGRTPPGEP